MKPKYDDADFIKIIGKVAKEVTRQANIDKENAGFAGEWGDRGAADKLKRLDYFLMGLNKTVPKEYQTLFNRFLKELEHERAVGEAEKDPDYALFKELEAKFGHLKG